MIKLFMELKGKIPNKYIRKGMFKGNHFDENCSFLCHETDKVTQKDKVVVMPVVAKSRSIAHELRGKCHSTHKSQPLSSGRTRSNFVSYKAVLYLPATGSNPQKILYGTQGLGFLSTIFLLKRGARDLKKQNMHWCS